MTRTPHAAHRYRVASRCTACGVRLLGACAYRTCAATIAYPVAHRRDCANPWRPTVRPTRSRSIDLVAAARRIFGADCVDALPMGED